MRISIRPGTVALHAGLILGSVIMVGPFVWLVLAALKDLDEIYRVPPTWIPEQFHWDNFRKSLTALPSISFGRAYLNSGIISIGIVLGTLLTSSMAAYAFAKLRFAFRDVIFAAFLAVMMVPDIVTLIPKYLMIREFGWLDTRWALIVPGMLLNPFGVFLLRQFMLTVPRELEEAAIIDGANRWQIYWRVVLPQVGPALSALGILTFVGKWNEFFAPLIYLSNPRNFTVPLVLNLFRGQYVTDLPLMMAGTVIAFLPLLIVYIAGQKYIIEGITLTGIKG
ncbi:carbohydrate ABC transporter permease [Cohnella cellulosilytica]|uniref:Carbohydrate ABC transporter permease n=1 Tax=Cohnella cellulosilytica TaxID=986710 RepID=A0ABW2FHL1_9BACL